MFVKAYLALMLCMALCFSGFTTSAVAATATQQAGSFEKTTTTTDLGEIYKGKYRAKQELGLRIVKFKQPVQTAGKVLKESQAYLEWEKKRRPKKGKFAVLYLYKDSQEQSYEFKYKTKKRGSWQLASFSVMVSPDVPIGTTGEPKEVIFTNTYDDRIMVELQPQNSFKDKSKTYAEAEPGETVTMKSKKGGSVTYRIYVWCKNAWIDQYFATLYGVPD